MTSPNAIAVFFDGNVYDRLAVDVETRDRLARYIAQTRLRAVASPVVVDELADSPFQGLPDWFPIEVEVESVAVFGYWRLGMARLGEGAMYARHRGESNKIADAIIADSNDSIADILVSD